MKSWYEGLKDVIARMFAGEHVTINIERFQNDMPTFESKDDVLPLLFPLIRFVTIFLFMSDRHMCNNYKSGYS